MHHDDERIDQIERRLETLEEGVYAMRQSLRDMAREMASFAQGLADGIVTRSLFVKDANDEAAVMITPGDDDCPIAIHMERGDCALTLHADHDLLSLSLAKEGKPKVAISMVEAVGRIQMVDADGHVQTFGLATDG